MQSFRSTSVRQLCRSATASITRLPRNRPLPALFCRTQPFTCSPTRWYSSTSQFHHQYVKETEEEKPTEAEAEETKSAPTKIGSANNSLYIKNIPYSTTDNDLEEIFSVYGPLSRVAVGRDGGGNSKGYAHIDFVSKQDAVKVKKDHQESPMIIGDREISLNYSFPARDRGGPALPRRAVKDRLPPSATIFIGNVPYEATREDVREGVKHLGDVTAVRIALTKEGNPRGFAHVDFRNAGEAEKVLKHYQHHPIQILDREVRLDRSSAAENANPPSPRLYFTGWGGDISALRSHFGALRSKIVDVYLFPGPNILTGSGFIEFRDLETAAEALTRFNTPDLALAYARSKNRSGPRSATRGDEAQGGFGLKFKRRYGQDNFEG